MSKEAKKAAVKEKFKARPGMGRIMPEKGKELVPVQHTQTSIEPLPQRNDQRTRKITNTSIAASRPPPAAPGVQQESQTQANRQANTQITQYESFARTVRKAPKRSDRTPWLFLVPALALVAFVWFDDQVDHPTTKSPFAQQTTRLDEDALARRAEMHRKITGWKMNRERVGVQIDNHFTAPALPMDAARIKPTDIMAGLPLAAEGHPRMNADERNRMESADHPDTRIMYGLQEEQDKQIFDQMAERMFVRDFIENARREGYELEVKADGTVKIKRAPSQETGPGSLDRSY